MAVPVTISSEINYLLELPFFHLDQTPFNVVLYEMFHGLLHYGYDRLNSLLFNPIEQSSLSDKSTMYNLDPDNHLSSCITLSDYFTEDEVNGKTSVSLHNPSYFSVLHLNARSLSKNIDNLKLLLGSLQKSFYAICVSETWLTDLSSDEVEIPGYKFISSHRVISGGTGIYLQEHFENSLRSDCNHSDPDAIESLFVEINNPHGKNIVVRAIYRPPNQNTTAFLDIFNNILSKVFREDKYCYLGGDYNLDLFATFRSFPDSGFSQ